MEVRGGKGPSKDYSKAATEEVGRKPGEGDVPEVTYIKRESDQLLDTAEKLSKIGLRH